MKVKIKSVGAIYEGLVLHTFSSEDIGKTPEFSEIFCKDLIKNGFAVTFSEENIETPTVELKNKVIQSHKKNRKNKR